MTGEAAHKARFNGATPLRVWKEAAASFTMEAETPLQRSHTFEGVEGRRPRAGLVNPETASTEPHL